jgi:hypothetical protein
MYPNDWGSMDRWTGDREQKEIGTGHNKQELWPIGGLECLWTVLLRQTARKSG